MSKSKICILLIFILFSCENNSLQDDSALDSYKISFNTPHESQTKSSSDILFNTTFSVGDSIGIFAVERTNPGTQAYPLSSGNYADNIKLVYQSDGTWAYNDPKQTIYYRQANVAMDFYAYYPYSANIDPTNISFNVSADQSGTGFSTSDLLASSALNQTSTSISLIFSHIMSLIQVQVTNGSLGADINANTTVQLVGVNSGLTMNLGTGIQTTTTGTSDNISMWRVEQPSDPNYLTAYTYRAVVPSQSLTQGNIIFSFIRNGRSLGYLIQTTTILTPGRVSMFNVTLDASLSPSHKYDIGDIYPYKGFPVGVIFSTTNGGLNGTIISLSEVAQNSWSDQTLLTNASDQNNGINNMNAITVLPSWQTYYPAFAATATFGTEWYLPSINELTNIYSQASVLNTTLAKFSGTTLSSSTYWSSTEIDDSTAKSISMNNGITSASAKITTYNIRPIKSF